MALPRRRPFALAAAVVAVLCCLTACAPRTSPVTPRLNVVLVIVDTLRADHLGMYGYHRDTSPNLDRFAGQNVLFTRAHSQAACTFPSVNSLLTSRHPPAFLVSEEIFMGIPTAIPSLPEILSKAGYATAAVSASPIVRRSPSRYNPDGGFGRGFDHFDESCVWQPATCVNWAAAKTLGVMGHSIEDESGGAPATAPFFLYLHYMEPHGPYRPPPSYERRFSVAGEDPTDGDPNVLADRIYEQHEHVERSEILPLIDRYDDEIAFFDQSFQELLELLHGLELTDSTILVLASDHGEEFLEHGHMKHCRTVFESSIHTPLILHLPGTGAHRVDVTAANLDIVPTLLEALAIAPPEGLEGESLLPTIDSSVPGSRIVHSHQGRWRSVATGESKLIANLVRGTTTFYDLLDDPGEQHGSVDPERFPPALVQALRRRLESEEKLVGRGGAAAAARRASERLRDLGYL